MHYFRFNKEKSGRWYIDLPAWTGSKDDLEMVFGADTMLDILSQGEPHVNLYISEVEFDESKFELVFDRQEHGGTWYISTSELNTLEVWLCHVTKFVFGSFPEKIYIA